MTEKAELTKEEVSVLTAKQKSVEDKYKQLGAIRKQILSAEKEILTAIDEEEKEIRSYLSTLATTKSIPNDGTWAFNAEKFCFVKTKFAETKE